MDWINLCGAKESIVRFNYLINPLFPLRKVLFLVIDLVEKVMEEVVAKAVAVSSNEPVIPCPVDRGKILLSFLKYSD